MKYEAKYIGGIAASKSENGPWTGIKQDDSLTACSAMGPGYQLISNPEWITVGSNIAALGTNWSSGTVGTGSLFSGHNDNNPPYACPASSIDLQAYVENNCTPKASGQGEDSESTQKRTFNLSNSQVIWDLTGNVGEWVNYINISDKPGATAAWYEYSALSGTTTTPLKYLVPTNAVKAFWVDAWNSVKGIGQFYPGTNGAAGAFIRGGNWSATSSAGVFYADLNSAPSSSSSNLGFRCVLRGLTPETPRAFAAMASKDSVTLSWAKGGSTTSGYLLVRGQAGKLPLFQPADGTTYTAGSQGNDTLIFVGNSIAKLDTGLTTGGNYHYRLFGYDSSKNYSSAALQSVYVTPCAENWVFVPGDVDYKTNDFCVMKYEAKSDGATIPAVLSQAASTPWVSISQQDSITKCNAIGPGYHLINNDEWMTIGANVAARASNWTSGTVGTGYLFAGHNDDSPTSACAASTDDSMFYVETTCTPVSSGDTTEQRRTLTLSNSAVIWDLSGNVSEWVNYFNSADKPGATAAMYEYTAVTGTTSTALKDLVPTNAVKAFWTNTWNSVKWIGQYYPGTSGTGGALSRGGSSADSSSAGMFSAYLDTAPSGSNTSNGLRCVQNLPDIDGATLTLTPGTTAINVAWTSTGATGYMLVRGPTNSEATFVPTDGTSYAVGAQGSDSILYVGTSLTYDNTSLTDGSTYFYNLYSYNANDEFTFLARNSEKPATCPTGYILVLGDKDYGTEDFCVMKYEAKNNGSNVAISQAASTPWVSISQETSKSECTSNGPGYELISNEQWMTIGASVAAINGNWTGGTVGSGYLFSGHNDNSPPSACAASSNDALFYVETSPTPVSSGDTAEQRRTHTLSNGAVIWDLSGNVWEWVNYVNAGDKPGATAAYYEYPAVTGTASTALRDLVPTNSVKAFWSDAWNSGKWIGQYYPGANNSGGALMRGSNLVMGSSAGVFSANLSNAPTISGPSIGFRCALSAP